MDGTEIDKLSSAYILASGPSILALSAEEKEYLNAHPYTLAMNKYLMYWNLVGILPKTSFLADTGFPAIPIILLDTLRVIRSLDQPIPYYINRKCLNYFQPPSTIKELVTNLLRRLAVLVRYKRWLPWRLQDPCLVTFTSVKDIPAKYTEFAKWATSLAEPLYWHRGSLTTAINIAAILFPNVDIKLIGVDMNTYAAFYDKEFKKHPLFKAKPRDLHVKSKQLNIHSSAVATSVPGVPSVIPQIRQWLQADGKELYSCNPHSLLIQEDLCEFRPIIDK